MAHENLKFPLSLEKNDTWQPIYGGQHHGTFYMIYIKIHTYEKIEMSKEKPGYSLECSFRLQNFRGAITIGLAEFNNHQFTDEGTETEPEPVLNFNLKVKPFKKRDYLEKVRIPLEKPINSGLIAVFNVFILPPPDCLFDPNDLDNSTYINPYSHLRDGDQYTDVAFRRSGTDEPFRSPEDMGWGKYGFCIPDVCIFE